MGEKITLALDVRNVFGKKVKTLRKEGIIPVTVYGAGIEPKSAQVPELVFDKMYRKAGRHTPVMLSLSNKKHIAMIKEVDVNPVTHRTLHASFHAVKASDPVVAEVPIRLVGEGESFAEKDGLVILQALEEIEVRALPMDLPEALEVSIVELKEAGERVTVADIKLPEGVEFMERSDGRAEEDEEDEERPSITDLVIASVYEPSALAAANEASAGDAETADADEVESEQGGEASNEAKEGASDKE